MTYDYVGIHALQLFLIDGFKFTGSNFLVLRVNCQVHHPMCRLMSIRLLCSVLITVVPLKRIYA
jgi:hypothetical protein